MASKEKGRPADLGNLFYANRATFAIQNRHQQPYQPLTHATRQF